MNITKRFLSILLFTAISVGAWAIEQDADGTYLIGSTDDWNDFASGINSGSIVKARNMQEYLMERLTHLMSLFLVVLSLLRHSIM